MVEFSFVRAHFTGDSEVTLCFKTGGGCLRKGLSQSIDLRLECLDVLKVFVLLSDLCAKLVVDLPFLLVDDV